MFAPDGYGLLAADEVAQDSLDVFDCGQLHLNKFLAETAATYEKLRLGTTRVVFHRDYAGPVGFFTISSDGLQLKGSERFDIGIDEYTELRYISSIKLGRMGVAKALQSQGVGRQMLDLVRGEALKHPARLLIVDAAADVVKFYEKNGFKTALFAQSLKDGDRRPRSVTTDTTKMWLDLAE